MRLVDILRRYGVSAGSGGGGSGNALTIGGNPITIAGVAITIG